MECMKCGRETAGKDVFCADCLKIMDKYPVNSQTPVKIYQRPESQRKNPAKKQPKQEEIIESLNQTIKGLRAFCALLAVLWILTAGALGYLVIQNAEDLDIGFNYSTATSETEDIT